MSLFGWYEHALTAVSEGMCPEHRWSLGTDGWCAPCGAWWFTEQRSDGPHVVTRYPWPVPQQESL